MPDDTARRQAVATGRRVEVAGLTTETTQVFAEPDGTFTLTQYVRAVRVKQNNVWTPVDTTLVRRADGTIVPKATVSTAVFSGGGSGPAVTMSHGDQKLAVSWPQALPAPVLSGSTATYPDVLPGVDLQLTATADAYSEVLVVHDAAAAANPALKSMHMTVSGTDLTVKANTDGTLSAADAKGAEVFRAPRPTMWDSALQPQAGAAPSATDPGSGKVSTLAVAAAPAGRAAATAGGGSAPTSSIDVVISPPEAALTGSGVRYPLFIDPWFTPGGPLYWISVSSLGKDYSIYNTSTGNARVGYCGWTNCNYDKLRSYFRMNTSGLQSWNGQKATVFGSWFYFSEKHSATCSPSPVDLYEAGIISSSTLYPGPLGTYIDERSPSGGTEDTGCSNHTGVTTFTATAAVQDAVNHNWPDLTFGLVAKSETDATQWKYFANNPHLDTHFSFPPTTPYNLRIADAVSCDGSNTTQSVSPHLHATTAVNGENANLNFEVFSQTTNARSAAGSTGPWGSNVDGTWQVNVALADGPYRWHASATNDSGLSSGWSGWQYFYVIHGQKIPAPAIASGDYPQNYWGAPAGTPGTLSIGANGAAAVGYAYAFQTGTPPVPTLGDCSYLNGSGNQMSGYVRSNNGGAVITVPGGLGVGRYTLTVQSFDAARNPSDPVAYSFFIAPSYGANITTKFEADASNTYSPTDGPRGLGVGGVAPQQGGQWSGGSQIWFGGSASSVTKPAAPSSFAVKFSVPLDADYAISTQMTTSFDYGKLKFELVNPDGTRTPLAGTDKKWWNGYTPTVQTAFLDLGGAHLKPGDYQLSMTVMDTDDGTLNSSTGQRFDAGLDYLRVLPVDNVTTAGFGDAMNNIGISDEGSPASGSFDDLSGLKGSGTAHSYSAQQLATAGWGRNATVTVDGATFRMPDVASGANDNVVAVGQTIPFDSKQQVNATAVGFLVSATCAGTGGISGATGAIHYGTGTGDGGYTMPTVPDWIGGPASTATVTLPRWNNSSDTYAARLYALFVPVDPSRPLKSITLPAVGSGFSPGACYGLHVFAMSVRRADRIWTASSASATSATYNLATALSGQTIRVQAHTSYAGTQARVRLSNTGSPVPVTIGAATVSPQASGASASGPVTLRFGGQTQVVIPAGGEVLSDPAAVTASVGGTMLVSAYFPNTTTWAPVHDDSRADMYVASGNHVGDASGSAFGTTRPYSAFVAGIDVSTPNATSPGTVVALGDESTNAAGSTADTPAKWTDVLAASGTLSMGIVNAGIDANQAGTDGTFWATGDPGAAPGGVSALNRLDRDVLAQTNVADVIVAMGADDIRAGASTTDVEARLKAAYAAVHQSAGYYMADGSDFIRVFTATIPPIPGIAATDQRETVRQAVNTDIVNFANRYSDPKGTTVINFDAAVRDGTGHAVAAAYLTNGQPNDQYQAALAQAVINAFDSGHTPIGGPAAPSAALSVDQTEGPAPLTVTADGLGSAPGSAGHIASMRFDFGDSSTPVTLTPNAAGMFGDVQHTYATAGTFTMVLTVTDTAGGSSVSAQQITIDPAPPVLTAALTVKQQPTPALTVAADGSASVAGPNPIATYSFDFGDGTAATAASASATANHTYAKAGTYSVTVTVADSTGATSTATKQAAVVGVPADGWKLNEKTGAVAADTGNPGGHAGTANGPGVTWGSGYALFAGTGGTITTSGPVLDTTKSFTVAAWVNPRSLGATGQTLLVQQASVNSGFSLEYNGSSWQFAQPTADTANAPTQRIASAAPASANVWTHLVGTYDATTHAMTLYVNGVSTSTGTNATPIASSGPLVMGRGFWNGSPGNLFTGALADVRVYQQALNGPEVLSLYQSSGSGAQPVPGIAGALVSDVPTSGNASRQLCLDLLNGDTTDSTAVVDVWSCSHREDQAWSFQSDGTIRFMGLDPATPSAKCVDTGGSLAQGAKITLYDCIAGSQFQQWRISPSASTPGHFSIVNPASGLCLDDPGSGTADGTQLQMNPCVDGVSQHFQLPAGSGQVQSAEAESIRGSNNGGTLSTQTNCCGGTWSNGAQRFLASTAAGNSLSLSYYVASAGLYQITPVMTKAADYGQVRLTVDQTTSTLPNMFDGWQASGVSTASFAFGTAQLTAGVHTFTFAVTGTDSASTGARYNMGIDKLTLAPTATAQPISALTLSATAGPAPLPITANATAVAGDAAVASYTFDFGDGSAKVGPQSSGTVVHTYGAPGTYTVTTTATDADQVSSSATAQVVVKAPGPLVSNGDFETGALDGWSSSYNSAVTTSSPHAGAYAGQINAPTGGNGAIERVVAGLAPNTPYTLTGWVRTDGGNTLLGAKQYESTGDTADAGTTSTGWTKLTDYFTTGATNTTVDIFCYRSTAGTSACDDISVQPIPAGVANPDFETGTLDGWGGSYNASVTTTSPHGGAYAGQLNATTGNNASVEQVITGLNPDTPYTLSGWVRTDGGVTFLGAKQYDTSGQSDDASSTDTGWVKLTDYFTTGASNTTVDVYCYRNTAGTSACDDISLTATPATVINSDFETGALDGWAASYNADTTTTNPHGGTYAGQLNATTGNNASVEQVVGGLTPNTAYKLTGWIRTDGGTTYLGAKQYDTTGDNVDATTTSTGWTMLTDYFATGASGTSVDIYCYRNTAGTSACDDVTLQAIPAGVANPDFETGNLDGWTASYNAAITSTNPHGGVYAGQLNATTGDNAAIEQVIGGLTPNTTYTLTGWVRTDGGTTYLGAKKYESTGDSNDATTTGTGWTQLSVPFTTGAGNTSVDIYCYRNTAGTSACDDIALTKS